ncbi:MAG: tetratricopeptide repeat protein [Phycisphaerae bacterium]|nr:tetratricopeptide repeat protein [Phycisphaerae bacterium]
MDTLEQGCKKCRFQPIVLSLAMGIVTFSLYLPTLHFDFVHLDDFSYVADNPFIEYGLSLQNVQMALTSFFQKNWHPLTWLSYMLDYELFGLNPRGYHLVNILFHTANGILLFWVLRCLTGATWKSFLVAALFAWHPLHVESVAWISERKDVLCAFFWILTLWAHWRYALKPCAKRNLLTLAFCLLALMAKPMAVTLPVVLLLMDFWPLKRFGKPIETGGSLRQQAGRLILEKTALFIAVLFTCILTLRAQHLSGAVKSFDYLSPLPRITNTFIAYLSYLRMMVWPVDLAVIYPHPHQLRPITGILCTILFIAVTVWACRIWKKYPFFTVGWFWYVITLVPVIGIVQVGVQALADRYTYIPLVGIFIIAVWGLEFIANKRPVLKPFIFASLCVALAGCLYLTRMQIYRWKDSITLFSHTLSVTDNNWKADWAIGCALNQEKQFETAEIHLKKAIAVEPNESLMFVNLAQSLSGQRKTDEAIMALQEGLKINPDSALIYYEMGKLHYADHSPEKALVDFQRAQNLKPGSRKVIYQIVWLLSTYPDETIRNGQEAVGLCEKLDFLEIPDAEYFCVLAAAYAEIGLFEDAVVTGEKALNTAINKNTTSAEMIQTITDCLEQYQQGLPYRDVLPLTE